MKPEDPLTASSSGLSLNQGLTPRPVGSVRAVVNGDGAILIDSEQGLMFSLNSTGGLIWSGLSANQPRADIVRSLSCQYGIPEAEANQDVTDFIIVLEQHRLLI